MSALNCVKLADCGKVHDTVPLNFPRSRRKRYGESTEIGIPGMIGGAFFAPFLVETVNGVPQVALRAEAIPDASIVPRMVAGGLLGTVSYANFSDVTKSQTQWNNSGAGDIIATAECTIADPSSGLLIDFSTGFILNGTISLSVGSWIKLLINGSVVKTFNQMPVAPALSYAAVPFSFRYLATGLPAGPVTVTAMFYCNATSSNTVTCEIPSLILQEMAKPTIVNVATTLTPSVSYRASYTGSASALGADIGSTDPYRVVVVALHYSCTSGAAPTLTIGGVSASRIGTINDVPYGTGIYTALFTLRYTSGTTADIVASIPGSYDDVVISVWKVVASSAAPASYGGGYSYSGDLLDAGIGNIAARNGGVMIIVGYGGAASLTASWGGTDTPTQRAEAWADALSNKRYCAYDMALTQTITTNAYVTRPANTAPPLIGMAAFFQ